MVLIIEGYATFLVHDGEATLVAEFHALDSEVLMNLEILLNRIAILLIE
jgi:hypothetical protein